MTEDNSAERTPLQILQELTTLASMDRRRGIDHWHDAELTEELRQLALEVAKGMAPATSAGKPAGRSAAKATGPGGATARANTRPGSAGSASSPAGGSAAKSGIDQVRQAIGGKAGSLRKPSSRTGTTSSAGRSSSPPPAGSQPRPAPARSPKVPDWPAPPLAAGREGDWEERLRLLDNRAQKCEKCGLCETRNKVVFGVGSSAVPLVFVGEAPGADEDRQGYPFVGRAGQLLDKIIQAIGLSRDEIYICNILKCRPPGNRNPAPDEIASCTPYLQEQLEILKPKVICTLGLFASQFLLESTLPMGKLRGQKLSYKNVPVIPTYHPAALLRNPSLKAMAWEDVQFVRRTLDE